MRTLRLSLVGSVILVLLGGMGGAAMAQEADAPALWVTGPGTQAPCEVGDVETVIEDGPVTGHRGLTITCADVPRRTAPERPLRQGLQRRLLRGGRMHVLGHPGAHRAGWLVNRHVQRGDRP